MDEHNELHEHGGCCDGCCGHDEAGEKREKIILIAGAVLLALSFIPILGDFVRDALRIACAVICGYPTAVSAYNGLKKFRFNEALLMTIAVIAAMFIREFFEAAAVAFLFRVGEALEDYASERSRRSLEAVFSIVPDKGHIILEDGSFREIDGDDIKTGMKLAVLPHEKVPVDGVIIHGAGTMDMSALTGESLPVEVEKGSKIISGSINGNTTLFYEATAEKEESGAARIVSMVKEASEKKGNAHRATEQFAKYYTPIVVALALVYGIVYLIISKDFSAALHNALVVVVASCPCAIVLSVPLAFLSSMGACAKNGIIIKGSEFIESLAKTDAAVLDKTGTITTGTPLIGEVFAADGFDREKVLSLAGACERHSSHPLAKSVMKAAEGIDEAEASGFEELPGGGTSAVTPLGRVCVGSAKMMAREGVDISSLPECEIYVSLDGKAAGGMEVINEVRSDSPLAVETLKKLGVNNITMLTGDSRKNAEKVCDAVGIGNYMHSLTPGDKLSELEKIKCTSKSTVYVGDGINDAPALALADTGVAMGLGTQAASEAADVILTDSRIIKLCDCIRQSKNTMKILKENIVFALIVKLVVIVLGLIGIAPLWLAVVADVGTMLLCVLNSVRLFKTRRTAQESQEK